LKKKKIRRNTKKSLKNKQIFEKKTTYTPPRLAQGAGSFGFVGGGLLLLYFCERKKKF